MGLEFQASSFSVPLLGTALALACPVAGANKIASAIIELGAMDPGPGLRIDALEEAEGDDIEALGGYAEAPLSNSPESAGSEEPLRSLLSPGLLLLPLFE